MTDRVHTGKYQENMTFSSSLKYKLFVFTLLTAIIVSVLGGGSSRSDVLSLLIVRPVLVLAIAIMIIMRKSSFDWLGIRTPLLLLVAMAIVMVLQLIPLPPVLWEALPGHGKVSALLSTAGMATVWRPLSLVPELTINSMLALLPSFAILIGMAGLKPAHRAKSVYVLTAIGVLSAVLGVLQLVSRSGYLYQFSDDTLPIGFFTNRNHQAALLAICLPALRIISMKARQSVPVYLFQVGLCFATGLFLLLTILLTGSRSGMLLAVIALGAIAFMGQPKRVHGRGSDGRPKRKWRSAYRRARLPVFAVLSVMIIVAIAYLSGRAASINRLLNVNTILTDQRISFAPITWGIMRDFFPLGSGLGTFDKVYRFYEPSWALHQSYFNHAHNDLVESILTGGLPFLAIIVLFIVWICWVLLFMRKYRIYKTQDSNLLLLSLAAIMILLTSSLSDYPLRTPLMGMVMAYACAFIGLIVSRARSS